MELATERRDTELRRAEKTRDQILTEAEEIRVTKVRQAMIWPRADVARSRSVAISPPPSMRIFAASSGEVRRSRRSTPEEEVEATH